MSNDNNFDMNQLMQKAKEMQQQMQSAQQQISDIKATGRSGNGLVEIVMNGAHYVETRGVKISPTLLGEEEDVLEDLVAAAINDAVRKVEEGTKSKMVEIAKNFKMPPEFEQMVKQRQSDDTNKDDN